jgi:DNA-3-methyladenine glycosylase II
MFSFEVMPKGPFSLSAAADFAGGFAPGLGGGSVSVGDAGPSILMAFPLESWTTSAAVDIRQRPDETIHGEVFGARELAADEQEQAKGQALRSLSLDQDGSGWLDVGLRDPVIAELQRRYDWIRPVCFYSAYESATSLVIGQRISMRQGARVKAWLGEEYGDRIDLGEGRSVSAFPRPQRLLEAIDVKGISAEKVKRIHGLARAALDGELDTGALRELPEDQALTRLEALPGVGPWTAQGILMRGCGVADAIPTEDAISREAVRHFYGLDASPTDAQWLAISGKWRPYRMWATVLLHMAWRREQPSQPSYRQAGLGKRERT